MRILPLGDSITWGWQPAYRQNGTDGYRAPLRGRLLASGVPGVEFVGTQHSGFMLNNDNEGHPGFTIKQIQDVMGPGLKMKPNIVLLHAGTNDLGGPKSEEELRAAPERLGSLVDDIVKVLPDAVVFVAKIIQAKDSDTASNVRRFNQAVPDIVNARVSKGFKVRAVDQSVVGVDELIDTLHP